MYNQSGGCLSNKTIRRMEEKGASQAKIDYARRTQYSTDPRDVRFHREYILDYNPGDPWREPNNFVLHPYSYQFGDGHRSPQFIGGMFNTLGQPVVFNGPPGYVHPAIAPYVVFR